MPLVIGVLLGLSGLAVVLYPLLGLDRDTLEARSSGPIAEVAERERSARDALREVEFDHRLGNLDDADYQSLRSRYERRALAALKTRYQREQELDALIEQQLDALRAQLDISSDDQPGATDSAESSPQEQHGISLRKNATSTRQASTNGRGAHNGARPATGPQARRRRGGRS